MGGPINPSEACAKRACAFVNRSYPAIMSRDIPEATVARLPVYLRVLHELNDDRVTESGAGSGSAGLVETVSSVKLAELAGVNAAKVRKDLSFLGSYGTRGVGYDIAYLIFQMSRALGLTGERAVIIAGAGHLGQALANYHGFSDRGFDIVAMVDVDPAKIGTELSGIPVVGPDGVGALVRAHPGCIVVLATPQSVAQEVADAVISAGTKSLLNFAPGVLTVPADVSLRNVDLGLELQVLSFYAERDEAPAPSSTNGARSA
jgi:redox-sensing transcriptional repressor